MIIALYIVTVRNKVAKVMFLQVSVILLTMGGGAWSWGVPGSRGCMGMGVPGPGREVGITACTEAYPSGRDSHCCGRYASYWNAFLLVIFYLL